MASHPETDTQGRKTPAGVLRALSGIRTPQPGPMSRQAPQAIAGTALPLSGGVWRGKRSGEKKKREKKYTQNNSARKPGYFDQSCYRDIASRSSSRLWKTRVVAALVLVLVVGRGMNSCRPSMENQQTPSSNNSTPLSFSSLFCVHDSSLITTCLCATSTACGELSSRKGVLPTYCSASCLFVVIFIGFLVVVVFIIYPLPACLLPYLNINFSLSHPLPLTPHPQQKRLTYAQFTLVF